MRTITGNIKILADEKYANKKLEFILCNLYGKQISNLDVDGQIATKKSITTGLAARRKNVRSATRVSKAASLPCVPKPASAVSAIWACCCMTPIKSSKPLQSKTRRICTNRNWACS